MRFIVILVFGLALGITAAAVLLYFNPLTARPGPEPDADTVLRYEFPSSNLLALTHGGGLNIPRQPREIEVLWETPIRKAGLSVLVLHDQLGEPAAIASRVSKLSPRTNLLSDGLLVDEHWLITFPGRGSYVLEAESNVWPMLKDTLVDIEFLKRAWLGPKRYTPTHGPGQGQTALVAGGTGEFRQVRGTATDSFELEDYRAGTPFSGTISGELAVSLVSAE